MRDYMPTVCQAIAANGYTVYAYFTDGRITKLDMTDKLNKEVFKPLRDVETFTKRLTVMNDTVAWDLSGKHDPSDCIDIDPITLYELPAIKESEIIPLVS